MTIRSPLTGTCGQNRAAPPEREMSTAPEDAITEAEIEELRVLLQADGYGVQKINALCDLALLSLR